MLKNRLELQKPFLKESSKEETMSQSLFYFKIAKNIFVMNWSEFGIRLKELFFMEVVCSFTKCKTNVKNKKKNVCTIFFMHWAKT